MVGTDEVAAQLLDGAHQFGEVAGGHPVVTVQERQVLALRGVQAGVARGGESPVLLMADITHLRDIGEFLGRAFENGRSFVLRMVVDQYELEIPLRVQSKASEGVRGVLLHVVERHDHGELWHSRKPRRMPGCRTFRCPYSG